MEIDNSTEFGQRVTRRLQEELIIWLTTVDDDNTPQPRPVWFLWDGESFLIYSRPDTHKLRHITRNPNVALNFDGNGQGGDIIVFTGVAVVADDAPPVNEVAAYIEKYQDRLDRMGSSPEKFAAAYSVALRVRPTKVRGH